MSLANEHLAAEKGRGKGMWAGFAHLAGECLNGFK